LNGAAAAHTKLVHTYDVQTGGLELPKIKRGFGKGGGGGAPTKYPFETMEVGACSFVANSEVAKGNAHKDHGQRCWFG